MCQNAVTSRGLNDVELEPTKRHEPRVKLILLYTRFFGENWNDHSSIGPLRPPLLPGEMAFDLCENTLCTITYNHDLLPLADAVGFHGPDIKVLPNRTRTDQIWFYFIMENPSNRNISAFNGIFNWTMTYRGKSEIHVPYGRYTPRGPGYQDSGEIDLEYKDMLVSWMVSNCNGKERNDYVAELSKHIQVDIYGYCGTLMCPLPRRSTSCRLLLRRYKFYLAFENGNCREYITEKYWENALGNDVVPIVMGGGDYSNPKLAIPHSYIDVRDFASPKELASYLIYLHENNFEYLRYFKWKRLYKLTAPKRACAVCDALHNSDLLYPPRVIVDMRDEWSKKECRSLNLFNNSESSVFIVS
ncbi:hypothetical protein QZH41_007306 [Actinostola sp. cb2023]|nr:hypothetical protein QZH41_007306 [Actinostola sp. cb2023]